MGERGSLPIRTTSASQESRPWPTVALSHIARGAPLSETLVCIANGIEGENPAVSVAILLLDERGDRLRMGAAPSLNPDYLHAMDGVAVDPGGWVESIEASPFWSRFRDVAERHGLCACAAIPILSARDTVLGVLVAYTREAVDEARRALAGVADLASIAIDRHDAETAQRDSERRMGMAIEGSGTGIWDRDVLTGEIHYSEGWKAILGYEDAEITNRIEDSYTRVHPDDLPLVRAAMKAHFEQRTESYAVEHRIRCKDGTYKWISSRGKVVRRDTKGRALRMIGTTTDITEMRVLSERLQQSVDLITSLTNEIPGLAYQYRSLPNGDAFFTYVSDGIRRIYEVTPEQVVDDAALVHALVHPEDQAEYRASLEASAANLTPWHHDYRVVLPLQGLCWRHAYARPRRLPDGGTLWHGFITDITERQRAEAELKEIAATDFLTQLHNRRYFMARMEEELVRVRAGLSSSVLTCDLDSFKAVNDTYGHAIGDLVLKRFANILRDALRKSDTVARIGGEEFAMILSGAPVAGAKVFARRVQQMLAERPLVEGGVTIRVTASMGIAAMRAGDASADASLARSDAALYRAKGGGRDRVEVVTDEDTDSSMK